MIPNSLQRSEKPSASALAEKTNHFRRSWRNAVVRVPQCSRDAPYHDCSTLCRSRCAVTPDLAARHSPAREPPAKDHFHPLDAVTTKYPNNQLTLWASQCLKPLHQGCECFWFGLCSPLCNCPRARGGHAAAEADDKPAVRLYFPSQRLPTRGTAPRLAPCPPAR